MAQALCETLGRISAGVGNGDQLAIGAGVGQDHGAAFDAPGHDCFGGHELHACGGVALEANGRRLHGVDALHGSAGSHSQADQRQQKHVLGALRNHALPHIPSGAGAVNRDGNRAAASNCAAEHGG